MLNRAIFLSFAKYRIYAALAVLAIASSLFLTKNVDLRVYWYGVNGFFAGTRPAYGPESGLGFPLEYRYPPVTYLLLFPLKWLSLRAAGFWWMLAAWATATLAVSAAVRVRHLRFSHSSIIACCAFLLAYVVLAVRYGNVQPFVIAWLLLALALAESYPAAAGILLALAVTFKIWPLLFLPWLFPRARRRAVGYFALSLAVLWIAPLLAFGVAGYSRLLEEWYAAVARVGTTYSEFYYFPGQSLRGVLLRYFTPVAPPLKSFPDIHVLSVSPHAAVLAWAILGIAIYVFFVVHMLRSRPQKLWAWDGAAFVLYSLLEPYAVKSGLISLGPAALMAACLFTLSTSDDLRDASWTPRVRQVISWANGLFLAACLSSFGQAILQYKPVQRYLLSFGLDFWAEICLLAAFFLWIVLTPLPESLGTATRSCGKSARGWSDPQAYIRPARTEVPDTHQASAWD